MKRKLTEKPAGSTFRPGVQPAYPSGFTLPARGAAGSPTQPGVRPAALLPAPALTTLGFHLHAGPLPSEAT